MTAEPSINKDIRNRNKMRGALYIVTAGMNISVGIRSGWPKYIYISIYSNISKNNFLYLFLKSFLSIIMYGYRIWTVGGGAVVFQEEEEIYYSNTGTRHTSPE